MDNSFQYGEWVRALLFSFSFSFSIVIATIACGGGSGSSSSSGGACLPIAPLRFSVLEHGREWEPVATLMPDGTIYQAVNKQPGPVFRIQGDNLIHPNGQLLGQCLSDRTLRFGPTGGLRFDAYDALIDPQTGQRVVYVYDNGEVDAGMGRTPQRMPWRVQGMAPGMRRTAEVLVFAAMASIDWHVH